MQVNTNKMKLIIFVSLAVVAIAVAAPPQEPSDLKIIRSDYQVQPEGGYNFSFETSNNIVRQETGTLKDIVDDENKPHKVITVRGSYSYKNADETDEVINYEADENGYRAEGPSIPK